MKTNILLLLLLLAPLPALAAERPGDNRKPDSPAPVPVVTLSGTLERRVAIGGETTGWSLRYGKKDWVDLLLPADAFAWITDGLAVAVTGIWGTKRYPERGEVPVFIVHEIRQVQT
jgi:hypothetical protein